MQPPRTRRQKEVLDFITRFLERNGHAPSYQMVARHLGVASKTAIGKHIKALEMQGLLYRQRTNGSFRLMIGRARNGDVPEHLIEWLPSDYTANDGLEETPCSLPEFVLGQHEPEEILAFRMPDDGMWEKCICEGDIVLLEKRSYGRDGDCLAITVRDAETLLRYYYRLGAEIELRPANDQFPVRLLSGDEIEIRGVFRGLLRPMF